jgi:succinate dehydrogenase/fumarate reductase flavoprotein subunit
LHYNGKNQKSVLTREALKRNVDIINRVMVFELLGNGRVSGALGMDTRQERMVVFQAKSVVLGTGRCVRLFRPSVPGWMFNVAHSPAGTGDGMAMAYRAGAGIGNIELTGRWAGPRYLARCGKASWVGVLRDPSGKPVGPFVTKPDRELGDPISDIYPSLFRDYAKAAKGPVYMDCRGISDEDYQYMRHFMQHEGLTSLLNHLDAEEIDLRQHPIEFGTYHLMPGGGIFHDDKGETAINGLFVTGDEACSCNGISMAATTGRMIGEYAADAVKKAAVTQTKSIDTFIEEKRHLVKELRQRRNGPDWKEVNTALQQLMHDYAGEQRTVHLLEAGQRYLKRLKQKTADTIIAPNQHDLIHCLEVFNLLDLGEVLFAAAMDRKETRGTHRRPDHPFTNPTLECFLVVRQVDGKPIAEWHELKC